jgi:inner membrane protein
MHDDNRTDAKPPRTAAIDLGDMARKPWARFVGLASLALGFLAALDVATELATERSRYRDDAVEQVAASWGRAQRIVGPVLTVPVERTEFVRGGPPKQSQTLMRLVPAAQTVAVEAKTERLRRGLFDVPTYRAAVSITARFAPAVPEADEAALVRWDKARLSVAVTDMRAMRGEPEVVVAGDALRTEPLTAAGADLFASGSAGFQVPLGRQIGGETVEIRLAFRGSERIEAVPLGDATAIDMTADWPDPSFFGPFAPDRRDIGAHGFAAHWEVSRFGRGFGSVVEFGQDARAPARAPVEAVGVRLFPAVDAYKLTVRAMKSGFLFVLYSFAALYLFGLRQKRQAGLLHYGLAGASVSVFFLLLLSLAEICGFATSYAAAAALVIGQLGLFAWSVTREPLPTLCFVSLLVGLYGALYAMLRAEEHSLLIGSLGLFAAIGAAMYLSRHTVPARSPQSL